MKRIPLVPIPPGQIERVSKHYFGWGESLSRMFPALEWELGQAGMKFEPREWVAITFYSALVYFLGLFSMLFIVSIAANVTVVTGLLVSGAMGVSVGFATFFYLIFYPKLYVNRKVKEIEKHLPTALRQLLIHVRSGVPLFNSLVGLSESGYGQLSREFKKVVSEINTGKSEIKAMEILAKENPSLHFRRIIWQLVNAMKSGADTGNTIKEIVDNLSMEQRVAIKKYGSELNPMALFYMVLVVIFPTLGIIFLLILSSFVGAMFDIELIMVAVLGFLVMVQFMFMGMIRTKRPSGVM